MRTIVGLSPSLWENEDLGQHGYVYHFSFITLGIRHERISTRRQITR